ncbi:MAG: phosphoribosylamine--glycine ligase [Gammaproteobacteria bacterium]|nr:phosphoribosylamine--glycine ligase [Gammaproteobacteria bacterium]
MNVLVIGGGGREHALAWKLAQSEQVDTVFVAPGNAGTAAEPSLKNVAIDNGDFEALANFAANNEVGLTVVGPEAPLVAGIVDYFSQRELPCFGPSAAAAELEGSKTYSKDFLARHNIPTGAYATFTVLDEALDYLQSQGAPIVVKADGLAAGKGVIVAQTLEQAEAAVRDMLEGNSFGEAGHRVVIEEFLEGEEASFIVVSDGVHCVPMASSQDHKRIGEADTGPNTGGMGAYSPAPVVNDAMHARIMRDIIQPTIVGMAADGKPYTGFLYAGLMITPSGEPKVIEFNCRFGDPETQPIMMRLESDLAALCLAALRQDVKGCDVRWSPKAALGVVMAAAGYPATYAKGAKISGLSQAADAGCKVFQAGTAAQDGATVTNGGRVLCVCALGDSIAQAQRKAYRGIDAIQFEGAQYRRDIGYRALQK